MTSHWFTGKAVKKPKIIASCIIVQYVAVSFGRPGLQISRW